MQKLSQIATILLILSINTISSHGHCLSFSQATPPARAQYSGLNQGFSSSKNNDNRISSSASEQTKINITNEDYNKFINNIDNRDAAILAGPNGTPLLAKNGHTRLIPASTLKILTALVSLHYLGQNYRFVTDFYLDADQNLKIKGYGDPLLISESLKQIASLISKHVNTINNIIIDDSYFQTPLMIPGKNKSLQPYDAPNGALCVNFNTVAFKTINNQYISAEKQTPLLPFALKKVRFSGLKEGRIMLAGGHKESIQYAGELFQYFLNQAGINVSGKIKRGEIDKDTDKLILHYLSQFSLSEVITRLMEFSNNFIANQLFLTAGVVANGPPGTIAKGIQASRSYIENFLETKNISISEGSGLSRSNCMSAESMLSILKQFKPHYLLLKKAKQEYYKTGTLNDVKSRAGYLEDSHGRHYPFVVFINTPGKTPKKTMQLFRKIIKQSN